jgi:hypothetical protein
MYSSKLECLSLWVTLTLVWYFRERLEQTFIRLHSKGTLLALPAYIRLGRKGMAVANTLAYWINYDREKFYETGLGRRKLIIFDSSIMSYRLSQIVGQGGKQKKFRKKNLGC